MKKEVYWLGIIIVLVCSSLYVVMKRSTKYGLDINGGVRAVLQANPKPGQQYDQATVEHVLENRLNSSGVSEPSIYPKGDRQFIVELPNVRNKDEIIQQLQTTAQMEFVWFRDVKSQKNQEARFSYATNKGPNGEDLFTMTDGSTNQSFRDQAQIVADYNAKIQANALPRTGATLTSIPAPLSTVVPTTQPIYLTADQQQTLLALNNELQQWNIFYAMELAASGTLTNRPNTPLLTGADVKPTATATIAGTGSLEPVCDLQFTDKGTGVFADFTRNHVNELLTVLLDGKILTIRTVTEPILNGATELTGGFPTIAEAQALANLINAGALPVPLSIEQVESVEATLGHAAVATSIKAGCIGLGLVLIFMAAYYLLPGLVADIALIFYTIFTLAIFKGALSWFVPSVTMTLPGIAGFILSVGMAVDANILIFERLKEELRNGKGLKAAIDAGFSRAFTAIRDSNFCTLITCAILFTMGTTAVKGFALTLGIGVVVSLFTAVTATRTMLYLLVDLGLGKNPALFGLKRQWVTGNRASETGPGTLVAAANSLPAMNVIRNRKLYYTISLAVIVPGIIFWALGGLKRSIEFTGGTQVEAVFNTPVTQDQVRKALTDSGYKFNLVQLAEGGKIAIVTVPALNNRERDAVEYLKVINPSGGPAPAGAPNPPALDKIGVPYKTQSHSFVGPTISKELTENALDAVVTASILIVLYMSIMFASAGSGVSLSFGLALRLGLQWLVLAAIASVAAIAAANGWQFNLQVLEASGIAALIVAGLFVFGLLLSGARFGTSAIVALLHDVLVLIGSFAILGYFLDWQIDSLFVTATLTVVGFSVHDTIVIFDRLRENLRHRLKGDSFEDLANKSILQSFARSINTSFTVVLTLLAMLFFGEPSTRLLIVALLIGIVSGTYSSIFNATPILVDWENWMVKRRATDIVAPSSLITAGASAGGGTVALPSSDSYSAPNIVKSIASGDETDSSGRPSITRAKKTKSRRF